VSIRIIEAGLLDTIQDQGRFGHSASGINFNGAMDNVAASTANYLVGNDDDEAVLEMHFPAAVMRFDAPSLVAITGTDFTPQVNDQPLQPNTAVIVPATSILQFTKIKKGARAYLAIYGGFDLPKWLGSYSTNLKAKAGGYKGRSLQKGDVLNAKRALPFNDVAGLKPLPWHADIAECYGTDNVARIIKGSEYDRFTECSETIFTGNSFSISPQSDRMGYRLSGSPLQSREQKQMISSAVTKGTIQLLPNGQLIVLMADHQTAGGYPKIGHVISADIPKLAQMQINTSLRFEIVSVETAEALLLKQHRHLHQLKDACLFRLQEFIGNVLPLRGKHVF
jgi:antagonist of KipI